MNIILQASNNKNDLNDYIAYAKRINAGGILMIENKEEIKVINASDGDIKSVVLADLLQ